MLRHNENGSDDVQYEKYLPPSLTLDGMPARINTYEVMICKKSVALSVDPIIST
jgi:hypothetical protein